MSNRNAAEAKLGKTCLKNTRTTKFKAAMLNAEIWRNQFSYGYPEELKTTNRYTDFENVILLNMMDFLGWELFLHDNLW